MAVMTRLFWVVLVVIAGSACAADPMRVHRAAVALFPAVPRVVTDADHSICGRDASVFAPMVYCTTDNTIYAQVTALDAPDASYRMAHLLGHAIQVQHGIADIALRAIRANRAREPELRGMVTRQVECLAGVLITHARLAPMRLDDLYTDEPHTGSHWGRNPLQIGPKVSVGLKVRARWFDRGQRVGHVSICAVGDVPVAPLIAAMR